MNGPTCSTSADPFMFSEGLFISFSGRANDRNGPSRRTATPTKTTPDCFNLPFRLADPRFHENRFFALFLFFIVEIHQSIYYAARRVNETNFRRFRQIEQQKSRLYLIHSATHPAGVFSCRTSLNVQRFIDYNGQTKESF